MIGDKRRWTVQETNIVVPGIGYSVSGPGAWNRIQTNGKFSLVRLESSEAYSKLRQAYNIPAGLRAFWRWILANSQEHRDELGAVFSDLSTAANTCGIIKIDLQFSTEHDPVTSARGYISALRVKSKTNSNMEFTVISTDAPTLDTGAIEHETILPTRDNRSSIDIRALSFDANKFILDVSATANAFSIVSLESSAAYNRFAWLAWSAVLVTSV